MKAASQGKVSDMLAKGWALGYAMCNNSTAVCGCKRHASGKVRAVVYCCPYVSAGSKTVRRILLASFGLKGKIARANTYTGWGMSNDQLSVFFNKVGGDPEPVIQIIRCTRNVSCRHTKHRWRSGPSREAEQDERNGAGCCLELCASYTTRYVRADMSVYSIGYSMQISEVPKAIPQRIAILNSQC